MHMQQEEKFQKQLFKAIATIKSSDEAEKFLLDLCTPAELTAMADRWAVVALIKQGVPYRKINELTGVSTTTVARVARFITHGNNGYNLIYQRAEQEALDDVTT